MTSVSKSPARPPKNAALACGRAVAASNLLKCAISGNDPNWGRIVSSLGTVPSEVAPYDSEKVTVDVNGVRICENGGAGRDRSEVDMTPREVHIDIDLNAGRSGGHRLDRRSHPRIRTHQRRLRKLPHLDTARVGCE